MDCFFDRCNNCAAPVARELCNLDGEARHGGKDGDYSTAQCAKILGEEPIRASTPSGAKSVKVLTVFKGICACVRG